MARNGQAAVLTSPRAVSLGQREVTTASVRITYGRPLRHHFVMTAMITLIVILLSFVVTAQPAAVPVQDQIVRNK